MVDLKDACSQDERVIALTFRLRGAFYERAVSSIVGSVIEQGEGENFGTSI